MDNARSRRFFLGSVALATCAASLAAQEQVVRVGRMRLPAGGQSDTRVTVSYSTADPADDTLPGLGLRLHWSSAELGFVGLEGVLARGLRGQGTPEPDLLDLDDDPATDTFLHLAWADLDGAWPGGAPRTLYTAIFHPVAGFSGLPVLRTSASSTAAGYDLSPVGLFSDGFETGDLVAWEAVSGAAPAPAPARLAKRFGAGGEHDRTAELIALASEVGSLSELDVPLLDVDGDGTADAATDGVLIVRHLFGFDGGALIDSAVAPGASRSTAAAIRRYLERMAPALDVDRDGRRDALTDGLLIWRFLAGRRGDRLVDGALGPAAVSTEPAVLVAYLETLVDPEGAGDSDGDGVSDLDEVVGYQILIDLDGLYPDALTPRWVSSDPLTADSDGDGLDDRVERSFRTDPRDADTDDDGLTDGDELRRYGSAPASVDSDGDARGPEGTRVPNPLFFDGNELVQFGTSPTLADTDGDGRSDFEEANQNATPPLVADVPRLAVELVGQVAVELEYTATASRETRRLESTLVGQSDSSGQSNTDTTSSQQTIGASATVTASASAGFPGGASASVEASVTVSGEYSEESTSTFTEESSTTVQEEFQESQETALTEGEEVTGGTLTTGIRIRNVGDVAFTLDDLAVTALLRDPDDRQRFETVATLIPQLPGGAVTLGPFNGQTGVLQVADDDLNTGLATSLLADPSGLYLDVATFSLEDAEGRNFAFLAEVTNARTALVTIDFGNGDVERYRVATLVERNPDGTPAGVTLGRILREILDIPFATRRRQGSTDPLFPDGVELLTRVRDVETEIDDDPSAFSNAYWAVLSDDPGVTGANGVAFTTDFEDITLRSGDTISLVYVRDDDRDGLFRREELLYGTTDVPRDFDGDGTIDAGEVARSTDFDRDGLSDFVEVRTGWTVGANRQRVHPDPTRADSDAFDRDGDGVSDGDGLDDIEELRGRDGCGPFDPAAPERPDPACAPGQEDSGDATDPTRPDTDGDGLDDAVDDDPLDSLNVPPVINLGPTFARTTGVLFLTGRVTDVTDPIDRVIVAWGDGEVTCLVGAVDPKVCDEADFDAVLVTNFDSVSLSHQYLGTGDFFATVTATDRRRPPGQPASASRRFGPFAVSFPGDPEALFFFDGGDLADRTAHGHDGEIGGTNDTLAQLTPDRFASVEDAYCLESNQVDECAWINLDAVPIDDQMTLAAWVLPDRLQGYIVGQFGYVRLFFSDVNGDVTFEVEDGPNRATASDPTEPPRQSVEPCGTPGARADWTLYVATLAYEGSDSTLRLYRGAGGSTAVTLVDETVVEGVRFRNPAPTNRSQIGGSLFGPDADCGSDFQGRIDDVRIYDRALSAAEVNALLNEVRSP